MDINFCILSLYIPAYNPTQDNMQENTLELECDKNTAVLYTRTSKNINYSHTVWATEKKKKSIYKPWISSD